MYVIELFKELNTEEIVDELFKVPNFFELIDLDNTITSIQKAHKKEELKQQYINAINSMLIKKVNYNDDKVILITRRCERQNVYYDASLFCLDKLIKVKNSINIEEIEDFNNPLYDLTFDKQSDVLGMKIAQSSLNKYSKLLIASTLLDKMTFFGITELQNEERKAEIEKELLTSEKEYEDNELKTYSIAAIYEKLGIKDTRTSEEKIQSKIEANNDALKYIKGVIEDISDELKYV